MCEETVTRDLESVVKNLVNEAKDKPGGFNLDELRVSQDFGSLTGVKEVVTAVRSGKPGRQDWVRAHPDSDHSFQGCLLHWDETRELYLVSPSLQNELAGEVSPARFFQAITRQGESFIWVARLASPEGKTGSWYDSMLDAVDKAKRNWVRVKSNMQLQRYEVHVADNDLGEPNWPEMSFEELMEIAFGDRVIASLDHPIVQKLRGQL